MNLLAAELRGIHSIKNTEMYYLRITLIALKELNDVLNFRTISKSYPLLR